jgi:hypothetical protein
MYVEEHFDSKRLVDKLIDIYSEPDTPARKAT